MGARRRQEAPRGAGGERMGADRPSGCCVDAGYSGLRSADGTRAVSERLGQSCWENRIGRRI